MMKKINLIISILLVAGFVSCKKGFLDVPPSTSAESTTAVQTEQDAQVMLNGIMRRLTNVNHYGRNFIVYADAKGGDLTVFSRGRGLDGLYAFDHSPNSGSYSGYWNGMFNSILQANNLIKGIKKLEDEGIEGDFDDILGQALTARAILFFDMVRIYGLPYTLDKSAYGIPNVTEPLDASAQPTRATVEENYQQILSDLNEAAPLLSKDRTNGYINYYANAAMKARVYLTMGPSQYGNALTAAEDVINNGDYELYSNGEWVDSWKSQFGKESIFELGMFPSEGDLENSSLSVYFRRQDHGTSNALGFFIASDYFLDRLGEDPDDVRWGVMDYDEVSSTHLGASYKYSGDINLSGDGKSNSTAVNIKVIRLSEMYLIAAEAALPTNKEKAADYLNAIRKRSPNLAPATENTITLDMIIDERSKELFTEGQRYFDMLRLGRSITFNDDLGGVPAPTRTKTIDMSFYKIVLPIPQDEINANPAIADQQNPQY